MRRVLALASATLFPSFAVAQLATATSDALIGKCVHVQVADVALLQRVGAPQFARLDTIQYRNQTNARWMRVAEPIGATFDRRVRTFEREANWRVVADTVYLSFSTGFTVVEFSLTPTSRDTFAGRAWVWNDDGPKTYPAGAASMSLIPCARLNVSAPVLRMRLFSRGRRPAGGCRDGTPLLQHGLHCCGVLPYSIRT